MTEREEWLDWTRSAERLVRLAQKAIEAGRSPPADLAISLERLAFNLDRFAKIARSTATPQVRLCWTKKTG